MKHIKWIAVVLSVVMALLALTACGSNSGGTPEASVEPSESAAQASEAPAADGEVMARIKAAGKIIMATSADYPPYEFTIEEDGERKIVGMDIMVAEEIARDLGVELEIQDMDFDGTLAALTTGNADFVLAGMTPDEERRQVVDFSDSYYDAEQAVIIRAADEATLTSVESLKDKSVGAQKGTVQMDMVEQQIAPASTVFIARIPNLIQELKNGNIDALVVEHPVAESTVSVHDDLMIADITVIDEIASNAVAVPKNNEDLLAAINATIDRLQAEGKIQEFANAATEILGEQTE